jgi:hypothetical protein
MDDQRRKFSRFDVNFVIFSNDIRGEGVNISKTGLGVLTDEEIIPAEGIPFEIIVKKNEYCKKDYRIKGVARLLFSIPSKTHKDKFYNGLEFIEFAEDNKNELFDLLKDLILVAK